MSQERGGTREFQAEGMRRMGGVAAGTGCVVLLSTKLAAGLMFEAVSNSTRRVHSPRGQMPRSDALGGRRSSHGDTRGYGGFKPVCQAQVAGAGHMERRSEEDSEARSGLRGGAPRSISDVCLSRCEDTETLPCENYTSRNACWGTQHSTADNPRCRALVCPQARPRAP